MTNRLITAVAAAALLSPSTPTQAQILTFATNPQGAVNYTAAAAVAKVAQEKLGMQIRVQPTAGSSTYVPLINAGEIELGIINVVEVVEAVNGRGSFEGKPNPNLRVLTVLFQLPLSALVAADSPIKTLKDLKGARLPSGYIGQTTMRVMQDVLLAGGGLTMQDVVGVPVVNGFQGTEALGAGKVDVATIAPGVAQVQKANVDLASRGGVRFLSIQPTPEEFARMRKFFPMKLAVLQPAPHLSGIVGPTSVVIYSMNLVTNAKLSDETSYKLVKMLHASRDDLVKITPALTRFDPKAMTEQLDVPWHAGAVKFFSEVKQWPPSS
jgi:TRAP transporter TAXI family solute receptor